MDAEKPPGGASVRFKSNSGFSIIETSIIAAIMGFVAFGMAQVITSSNKMTKSILQKVEMVNLNQALLQTLVNEANCSCQLAQPAFVFDSDTAGTSMDIGAFKTGCGPNDITLVQDGQKLPGTQSGLIVEKVQLLDIRSSGPVGSMEYTSTLSINFASPSLEMARRGVRVPIRFLANAATPANAREIQTCSTTPAVPAQLACVSAVVTATTGVAAITGSAGYTPASVNEVFNYRGGVGNESNWGIGCNPGWVVTGCNLENNETEGKDQDIRIINNFCQSDGDEYNADTTTMYATCCSVRNGP